jgi:hypothetical protein
MNDVRESSGGGSSPSSSAVQALDNATVTMQNGSRRMNPEKGKLEPTDGGLYLEASDPFEAACIEMVKMNRLKRADYALDGDPFSNFHQTSAMLSIKGFGPIEAVLFNLTQKMARLTALRSNGRMEDTKNESVQDTYLDIAVYATILFAMVKHFS